MGNDRNRVMILGLDGATLDLIRPWAEAGILPTFQKLMREGAWGPLRSTMPPLTPVAWSSFMTGKNPGKHGVFEFSARIEDSYDPFLIDSSIRQAPSFWQLASRAGKRVIVYNVPVTYPPERVNGLMVSGLLTPDGAKDASYPRELQQELEQAIPGLVFYGHDLFQRGHEDKLVRDLLEIHDQNFRAAGYLMARQPWDLFMMVFQHTDTIGHFMWKHMENKGAGLPDSLREVASNAIQAIYRDVDTKLGELIKTAGEGTHVIIMSDHGHGRLDWYFAVNTWLLEKGYIKLKSNPITRLKHLAYQLGFTPTFAHHVAMRIGIDSKAGQPAGGEMAAARQWLNSLFLSFQDIDWTRTRAYSVGTFGPIFVNLKGREPHGSVEPGNEYETVLDELVADLALIQEPGANSPLFAEILRGREVYSGPYADRGPDLVFAPRNWKYNPSGRRQFEDNHWLTELGDNTGRFVSLTQMRVPYTGTHRMDGIFFLTGAGVRSGFEVSASIMDIAPTALALLGVPVPEDMDGRVLEETLLPEWQKQLQVTYAGADGLKPDLQPVADISAQDEELLLARLRNLGYVT